MKKLLEIKILSYCFRSLRLPSTFADSFSRQALPSKLPKVIKVTCLRSSWFISVKVFQVRTLGTKIYLKYEKERKNFTNQWVDELLLYFSFPSVLCLLLHNIMAMHHQIQQKNQFFHHIENQSDSENKFRSKIFRIQLHNIEGTKAKQRQSEQFNIESKPKKFKRNFFFRNIFTQNLNFSTVFSRFSKILFLLFSSCTFTSKGSILDINAITIILTVQCTICPYLLDLHSRCFSWWILAKFHNSLLLWCGSFSCPKSLSLECDIFCTTINEVGVVDSNPKGIIALGQGGANIYQSKPTLNVQQDSSLILLQ